MAQPDPRTWVKDGEPWTVWADRWQIRMDKEIMKPSVYVQPFQVKVSPWREVGETRRWTDEDVLAWQNAAIALNEAYDTAIAVIEEMGERQLCLIAAYVAAMQRNAELDVRCERQAIELKRGNEMLCPGPSWYWVRGHWRSHGNGGALTDSTPDATNSPNTQFGSDSVAVCVWETERWAR